MSNLSFRSASVLVVGDIMLDRYSFGDVRRISPEAPVPVVRIVKESWGLGGAGNVANNIVGLRAKGRLLGLSGKDEARDQILAVAAQSGIRMNLIGDSSLQTTVKCRIIGAHQQMLRLDYECDFVPSASSVRQLKKLITQHVEKCRAVVISDYAKGVCAEDICRHVITTAKHAKVPVVVDPKSEDWGKYAGATYITPNHKELCLALGRTVANEDDAVTDAARQLVKRFRIPHVLVTRSEKGMSLVTRKESVHIHSLAQEVYDVSGAGDTVVGTFGAALASGYSVKSALDLANTAAGIVVGKLGTVPIALDELQQRVKGQELFRS